MYIFRRYLRNANCAKISTARKYLLSQYTKLVKYVRSLKIAEGTIRSEEQNINEKLMKNQFDDKESKTIHVLNFLSDVYVFEKI